MHERKLKKLFLVVFLTVIFSVVTFNAKKAEAAPVSFTGWAWSDNIGWISFNCRNDVSCASSGGIDYEVTIDLATNNLAGWAWSDNIGWISFNNNACPPINPGPCNPRLNSATGDIVGWVRACAGTVNGDCTGGSRTDGWDGWISLNCLNRPGGCNVPNPVFGVNTVSGCNDLQGYAWGSDVVGWISFSGVATDGSGYSVNGTCPTPPLTLSCRARPNPAFVNKDVTWIAGAFGGTGIYTYAWVFDRGTAFQSIANGNPVIKRYGRPGTFIAEVTVTDSSGTTATANCDVRVVTRRREIRPEPL